LCDDSGIIEVRAKEITLRLLDKGKIKTERNFWIIFNMLVPALLIVMFGVLNQYIRKRKYTQA
jgi:ABC-2 type transport system permease protein